MFESKKQGFSNNDGNVYSTLCFVQTTEALNPIDRRDKCFATANDVPSVRQIPILMLFYSFGSIYFDC